MKPFPHHYRVTSSGGPTGEVALTSEGLEPLRTAPPAEFGGPGDLWSPETLLVGAMADCFLLTFRAVARNAQMSWISLDCNIEGVLEREGGNSRFTQFVVTAHLRVPAGTDTEAAERALHKAEHGCLISNSLSGRRELKPVVEVVEVVA